MTLDYCIENIIDLRIFEQAMDAFFDATNVIRIGLKDPEGFTLVSAYTGGPEERSPVCGLVRSSPEGKERCHASDCHGVQLSKEKKSYVFYSCHAGLTELAVPLYFEDLFVGSLMSGQVLLAPLTLEKEEEILKGMDGLPIDPTQMREALQSVTVINPAMMEACVRLVALIGQNMLDREMAVVRKAKLLENQVQVAEERERTARLEAQLRQAELEVLQAQINPHFLFNALNTVARLAILENAPSTEKMAYALSRLLRYSLRKMDQPVLLSEEFDQVTTYLEVQKIRFQDRLEVDLLLPQTCSNFKIPAMTIQPLVENSLIHGLEPKMGPGKISVTARRKKDSVIIWIADTGAGIEPQRLAAIQERQRLAESPPAHTGLGIASVRKRLEHYFGSEYTFEIHSEVNQGTTITLRLPFKP